MVIKRIKRKRSNRAASEVLEDAAKQYKASEQADRVSIGELMEVLHERGFGILLVIFVLPNCIPIPAPGLVSLTALPLLFLSGQMLWGADHPWLPSWINGKTIKRSLLATVVSKASPVMRKIEKLLRQRASFASSETGEKIVGGFCLLFSLCILIPLPWTNFIPGYGILVMALGLLSRDGVVMLLGMLTGLAGTALTIAILVLGSGAVKALLG
jgi:hypothetical protein